MKTTSISDSIVRSQRPLTAAGKPSGWPPASWQEDTLGREEPASGASQSWRGLTRRRFFRSAAGTGAGIVLGSKIGSARAQEAAHPVCPAVPRPIPHISSPPGAHFFFPGPVEGVSANVGHDPSIITDFSGVIAQADLNFSGTGTKLDSGASAPYDFHCDMRFMSGVFVGLDNEQHPGNIGFI